MPVGQRDALSRRQAGGRRAGELWQRLEFAPVDPPRLHDDNQAPRARGPNAPRSVQVDALSVPGAAALAAALRALRGIHGGELFAAAGVPPDALPRSPRGALPLEALRSSLSSASLSWGARRNTADVHVRREWPRGA
jgi:hypothetical protein